MQVGLQLFGGLGLFLLGMVLLTDGLKAYAGDSLRRALVRFTGTPLKAFASGALVTVVVQSSSATTVTLIGFVSAGLITFPQAVGVVLGASLGTTGTGWLVAVLGLKVRLGAYALPLVGTGAFMRLLGRGRWRSFGLALAGFGLIFVGIETLQNGMARLSDAITLAALPSTGAVGHVIALVIGMGMTVLMQSSTAAVATTLTALHTGAVNFEQASALVIGAAIGTTVTGALAVVGGSIPAKRTALAHVLFNLCTGTLAIALLPAFLWGIQQAQRHLSLEPGATSLAAFHTAFIALGVLVFLPFLDRFARAIERLLPDTGPQLTRHLDDTLLQAPTVALEATRRALRDTARTSIDLLRAALDQVDSRQELRQEAEQALAEIQEFFARIPAGGDGAVLAQERVDQMHAIDHLLRLQARLDPPAGLSRLLAHRHVARLAAHARGLLEVAAAGLDGLAPPDWLATIEEHASALAALRRSERQAVMQETGGSTWRPIEVLEAIDAIRWLERVGYHGSRVCAYLMHEPHGAAAPLQEQPSASIA